jgi:molybdopterin/thiamine biosynthesis adenylyltransferase
MTKIKVTFVETIFEEVKKALCWKGKERAAYILCHSSTYGDRLKLIPYKVVIPKDEDYVGHSPCHYELDKAFINKTFNEAIETQSDIIQCHVHPSDPGVFSGVDEVEEPKFMRHIADKIEGIFHGSLVFGRSLDTLDGWFFNRVADRVVPIEKVMVVGKNRLKLYVPPRSFTKNAELSRSLIRTVLAFGQAAVRLLGLLDIGVVGMSALGGPISEFLSRDRFKSVFMCDPDVIEETNLNRLPGTTPQDIGKPKVEFYGDFIERINPEIEVMAFQKSFYEDEVQQAFSHVDLLFGCVDSGARLSINRLAMANLIPYFDLGAGIEVNGGKPSFIGGQVYSVIPGREVCLSCTGVFDNLLPEYNSATWKEAEIRQGYLKSDEGTPNPLVMFLDYTIAGIGYQQMLKYVWGSDDGEIFSVHFDGTSNKLWQSGCSEAGCINCEPGGFLGVGDRVPFMVPEECVDFSIFEMPAKKKGDM